MQANPLLSLFKEQLESECASLGERHGLKDRGRALIYWYFTRLHDFSEADVAEVICDGGGDLGIDAIWIDDEDIVHFYQFKHPENALKSVPAGDVDKIISGLRLVLMRKHDNIANAELKARLEEVYQQVRSGYRIHLISSAGGIHEESRIKLEALVDDMRNPSASIVQWDEQPLTALQDRFYRQSLPAVKDPLRLAVPSTPYMLRSGIADCYLFSLPGHVLADLYKTYGEGLLQRNIPLANGIQLQIVRSKQPAQVVNPAILFTSTTV